MASNAESKEAIPVMSPIASPTAETPSERPRTSPENPPRPRRTSTSGGTHTRRTRGSSLVQTLVNSSVPLGMWQATGEVGSKIPTLPEIRKGAFSENGWSHEGQLEERRQNPHDIHRRRMSRTNSSRASTPLKTPTAGEFSHSSYFDSVRDHPFVEEDDIVPEEPEWNGRGERKIVIHGKPEQQNLEGGAMNIAERSVTDESSSTDDTTKKGPDETGTYPNGYRFPRKHTWGQSTVIGLKGFWKFFITPMGFAITIYGLNVVGWGAMIFFVLLNAAPAMCNPSCDDKKTSARQIWIEIDSQVLNALFCVTGFGLLPWRLRDFYHLVRWRFQGKQIAHRRLAGIYHGWYRLPGSDNLPDHLGPPKPENEFGEKVDPERLDGSIAELEDNPAVPVPATSMPEPPLTGVRAPPTKSWNLDLVIWMYILNSVFQTCLAGVMWGMNRYNRPSWATGLFVTLGCGTGIAAGVVVFIQGSKVKKVEGISIKEYDVVESIEDFQDRRAKEEKKEAKKQKKVQKKEAKNERMTGDSWFSRN